MEELGGKGRVGAGEGVVAPFNVLPPGATDLVAPLVLSTVKTCSRASRVILPSVYLSRFSTNFVGPGSPGTIRSRPDSTLAFELSIDKV